MGASGHADARQAPGGAAGKAHRLGAQPEGLQKPGDSGSQKSEDSAARLPLRWGLIFLASGLAAVVVYSVAGPAAAIATGIAVAVGLDRMLA